MKASVRTKSLRAAAVVLFVWNVALFAGSLAYAAGESPEQALAAWVPPSVLVLVAFALFGAWKRASDKHTKAEADSRKAESELIDRRLGKIESTLETIRERLSGFATTDALGRMGDRMDGRITGLASTIEVVKDRMSRGAL